MPEADGENEGSPAQSWSDLRTRFAALEAERESRQLSPAEVEKRLQQRAEALRQRVEHNASAEKGVELLIFRKGTERFGVPIDSVVELYPLDHFSPLPQSPAFILGAIHCRGRILALLDLGRLLGNAEQGLADVHYSVVLAANGRHVALAAGILEDIVSLPESKIQPSASFQGDFPDWIQGICQQDCLLVAPSEFLSEPRLTDWK